MCSVAAQLARMIRIDGVWPATDLLHLQAGTETALARVMAVFGGDLH